MEHAENVKNVPGNAAGTGMPPSKKKGGKNSATITTKDIGGVDSSTATRLKSFIQRIENLESEKAGLGADIKEVYAEAKGTGFDVPTIRKIIKLRKMDTQKRTEEQELLMLYATAIGMQLELGV